MDINTLKFILLFLLIVIGLIVIPYLYVYMLSRKYGYERIPFYYLIPVLVIYLFLFCRYCPELVLNIGSQNLLKFTIVYGRQNTDLTVISY